MTMAPRDARHGIDDPARTKRTGHALLGLLLLAVAAELVVELHPHFEIDSVFGFAAWFGFGACVGMVALARGLTLLLGRAGSYYGRRRDD